MAKRPRRAARDESTVVNVSTQCRKLAVRFDELVNEIRKSFSSSNPDERVAHVERYTNELTFDAFAFVTWLERNKHPGTADLEKRRIYDIVNLAAYCAASDQPQFLGGKQRQQATGEPSTEAQLKLGVLVVTSRLFGQSLRNWADQIDEETRIVSSVDLGGSALREPPGEFPCFVTLQQMAAVVQRSKKTLERLKEKGKLPPPDIKGGDGKPDEWDWSKVRTALEAEYKRQLPEQYPSDRFVRA